MRLLQSFCALLFSLSWVALVSAGEPCFVVANYPTSSPEGQPYLYTPTFGPGMTVCVNNEDQDAILIKECKEYQHGGVSLTIDNYCVRRCQVWRATLRFSQELSHAPLEYEYPHVRPSGWYLAFWQYLAELPSGSPVDATKLQQQFWDLFVEHGPKSYDDLLKLHYGLEPIQLDSAKPNGCLVNLQPGMRLRVESSVWQDISKPNVDAPLDEKHRGYVQTGTSFLRVSRQYGDLSTIPAQKGYFLTFDAFLGHVANRFGVPNDPLPGNRRSGPLDLHIGGEKFPHYRLYIPPSYTPGAAKPAEFAPNKYVLVVGAATPRPLTVQSDLPDKLAKLTAWEGPSASLGERTYFTFRGRTVVVPEVAILLDGREEYVPVATTFRQVADRLSSSDEKTNLGACLRRRWQNILCPVRFAGQTPHELDLPIAKGDRISWCP